MITKSHTPPVTDESREIDWERIYHSPEFQQLRRRRTTFTVSTVAGVTVVFTALLTLQAYFPELAAAPAIGSLNLSFVLAMCFLALSWVVGMAYSWFSGRVLAPAEATIVVHARQNSDEGSQR